MPLVLFWISLACEHRGLSYFIFHNFANQFFCRRISCFVLRKDQAKHMYCREKCREYVEEYISKEMEIRERIL